MILKKQPRVLKSAVDVVGPRHQRLVGRGASALWVALRSVALRDNFAGEVIMPDIMCIAVLEAVLAAGFTPRLADVDPDTYTVTPETIRPLINDKTQVVLAAHLFGHAAPLEAIMRLARDYHLVVIEDAVQGIGGFTIEKTAIGTKGDFAFISFDSSKIITGRGALLLYDDDTWTPLVEQAMTALPDRSETATDQLLNTSLRDLYHGIGQAARLRKVNSAASSATFKALLPNYAPLLFRHFDDRPDNYNQIASDWESLLAHVEQRNTKAAVLRQALTDLPVIQPVYRPGDAIWRYTIRFQTGEMADRFIIALRERGGLASNLYYPLNQLYEPDPDLRSTDIARCLVNLWVDKRVDERYPLLVKHVAQAVLG